jgi:hypothetical protein
VDRVGQPGRRADREGRLSKRVAIAAALGILAFPGTAGSAAPPGEFPWGERLKDAKQFAAGRAGKVSIGVVDPDGRFHGYGANRRYNSASTVKVMLMVAYLRHGDNNDKPLTSSDKRLLGPMIKRSDNDAATTVRNIVGNDALVRLAKRSGMERFRPATSWGLSQITARDQAVWMYGIREQIPERHRQYAMRLLTRIVPSQSWGIPPEAPGGWKIYFKGGWAPSGNPGWTVNQVSQLRREHEHFALTVLTRQGPSYGYGRQTIRGVAKRLLEHFGRFEP